MPYNSGNYSFVIDSSFNPLTQEELLRPLLQYKEAYEQSEAAYKDLSDKANVFKDLSTSLPEGSDAKAIYEGYANELNAQAQDLARNGLSMNNRRSLTNLKSRYAGEIGLLEKANEALQADLKIRNEARAKGIPMLYLNENLTIDDYLGGKRPNTYGVSTDDLYKLGADAGKAMSARRHDQSEEGSIMNDYYNLWKQTVGMSEDELAAFMQSDAAIELADNLIAQKGGAGLSGTNLATARQSVLNGIYNSVVYDEEYKSLENKDKLTAWQRIEAGNKRLDNERSNISLQMAAQDKGYTIKNGQLIKDPNFDKDYWKYNHDKETGRITGFSKEWIDFCNENNINPVTGSNRSATSDPNNVPTYNPNKNQTDFSVSSDGTITQINTPKENSGYTSLHNYESLKQYLNGYIQDEDYKKKIMEYVDLQIQNLAVGIKPDQVDYKVKRMEIGRGKNKKHTVDIQLSIKNGTRIPKQPMTTNGKPTVPSDPTVNITDSTFVQQQNPNVFE